MGAGLTKSDTLNYRGELFLIGANQAPLLTMMGGLGAGKRSSAFTFAVSQPWNLGVGAQTVQTEDASIVAGTPTTVTRAQVYNCAQIMKRDVAVSFKKQSTYGQLSGINTMEGQPVTNELGFQKTAALRQLAKDVEYSIINGTYVAEGGTGDATATRGLLSAISTNTVAGAGAKLTKGMVDELVRKMAVSGSPFTSPLLVASAYDVQNISDIYGYAPMDRRMGGMAIKTILTDFAEFGVLWDPQMPAGSMTLLDMSVLNPVFVPVRFDGSDFITDMSAGSDVLWVKTALTAASIGGFFYTQFGLDYGPEQYHGKITGLAVV